MFPASKLQELAACISPPETQNPEALYREGASGDGGGGGGGGGVCSVCVWCVV